MRGILAVAWRETRERRLVLAAAALAALVPIAVPLLRGLAGPDADAARAGTAFLLSTAFALGLVIGLGVSILAPAIASRRIGFDFARPVSSVAIWYGRLCAAIVLAVLAGTIIWVPAWLAGTEMPWRDLLVDAEIPRSGPLVVLAGLIAVFSLFHAASVMARSRSGLLALDAGLAVAAGLAFTAVLSVLPAARATEPRARVIWIFALLAAGGLVAAGFASVARGRTDARAAHRALSSILWTFVGVGLAVALAYASWVMAALPRDIGGGFWATPAAAGPWLQMEGQARGLETTFLYDTASGRWTRLPAGREDWIGAVISRDGRRAAWLDGSGDGPYAVVTLALDTKSARPTRTRLVFARYPYLSVLSPDGSRLATAEDGVLSIHDLASGRTLVSARLTKDASIRGFFTGDGLFRVYEQTRTGAEPARVDVSELDVATKSLRKTGEVGGAAGGLFLIADRTGARIVAISYRDREVRLCDARTGAQIAQLAAGAAETSRWPGFLADGRIVLSDRNPDGVRLLVFQADGTAERVIPLPSGRSATLGGELAPGRIFVAVGDGDAYATQIVDTSSGAVRKVADGLYPAARLSGPPWELNAAPEAGTEATRLFTRGGKDLVRLDPDTGAQTVLLSTKSGWPTP